MSTASITSDEVLSILNDLLENSRDGEYGFRACADEVEDAQIKQVFANRSAQCAAAAAELATLIRSLGGEEKAMQFFANAVSERNTLRFESVGSISDDVNAVKNRLASSSMDAYFARQMASTAGVLGLCR